MAAGATRRRRAPRRSAHQELPSVAPAELTVLLLESGDHALRLGELSGEIHTLRERAKGCAGGRRAVRGA